MLPNRWKRRSTPRNASSPARSRRTAAPNASPLADRGERVADVVEAGDAQFELAEELAVESHGDRGPPLAARDGGADQPRVRRVDAVADHLRPRRDVERIGAGVVGAEHDGVRRGDEGREGAPDVVEIAIDVEVVRLDVGDHRDRRREREERAVVLVGFDDVGLLAAGAQVSSPAVHAPAHQSRRLQPGRGECVGGHHRRRRLAVRAGDRHERRAVHRLAQRLGASHDRKPGGACGHEFGMITRNRRRHHDRARARDVPRVVSFEHTNAERGEVRGVARRGVASGDGRPAARKELGERTHPCAGNADEVDRPRIGGVEK